MYVFQPPINDNGKYRYVIFNDGTSDTNRTITQAVAYESGYNYSTTNTPTAYGEQTTAAIGLTDTPKTNEATIDYPTEDKYIFIVNNGTKNLLSGDIDDRYVLDDLHITFYSDAAGNTPVGNTTPGYVLDQLTASYDGDTVYRIKVPT